MVNWEMQATPKEFQRGIMPGLQNRLDSASEFSYRAQLRGLNPFYAGSPFYPWDGLSLKQLRLSHLDSPWTWVWESGGWALGLFARRSVS